MRASVFVSLVVAICLVGCNSDGDADHQAEWREVLRQKQAAAAPNATAERKQAYADSLHAFVKKHPSHSRARQVWQRLQLGFAKDLSAIGRYRDAIRFYRDILAHDPDNDEARRGLALAADHLAVTHEKLLAVEKGMSHHQVASILGKPIPGWTAENRRGEVTFEAWYYRTPHGALAAVYFRDGKVIAAEETSDSQLGRLGT